MLVVVAVLLLVQFQSETTPDSLLAELADCASPEACMTLLDQAEAKQGPGRELIGPVARAALRRHGRAGIEALAERRREGDFDRRNRADSILAEWPDLKGEDLVRVAEILSDRDYPSLPAFSVRSVPLEALPLLETANATQLLRYLGYQARDALLERYSRGGASSSFHDLLSVGEQHLLADEWTRIAADPSRNESQRVAALRALTDLGWPAYAYIHRLREMDGEPEDGERAEWALKARANALDPALAPDLAERCVDLAQSLRLLGEAFRARDSEDWLNIHKAEYDYAECMTQVARHGVDARPASAILRPLTRSEDIRVRRSAYQTLAHLGDAETLPVLREALLAEDWSEAYAAVLAFRHMAEAEDLERVEAVAQGHWLTPMRLEAHETSKSIQQARHGSPSAARNDVFLPVGIRPARVWAPGWPSRDGSPVIDTYEDGCIGETYTFSGRRISRTDALTPLYDDEEGLTFAFNEGTIRVIHGDKWGGGLEWIAASGEALQLINDTMVGVAEHDESTLIIAAGLTYLTTVTGDLFRVEATGDGEWRVARISTLPATPRWLADLGDGLYGAATGHGLVVFDTERVIGLASCETGPWPPEAGRP